MQTLEFSGHQIALAKVADGGSCKEICITADDIAKFQRSCNVDELKTADDSRRNALSVLESCLKHFEHISVVCPTDAHIKQWKRLFNGYAVECASCDKRYAVLSPGRVKSLIEVMKKIQFKVFNLNPNLGHKNVLALVFPRDKTYTVYLHANFWKAADEMARNCKMGTLIHEVSHFLGTIDATYEQETAEGDYVLHLIGDPEASTCQFKMDCYFGKLARINANNLQYEFELSLSHDSNFGSKFHNGGYACCGSTDEYSVCHLRMRMLTPKLVKNTSWSLGSMWSSLWSWWTKESFVINVNEIMLF